MIAFRNASIQRKLIAITMLTSTVALLLASLSFGIYDLVISRRAITSDVSTLAKIVGANSTAALSFNDSKSATETLAGLAFEPSIVSACIFNRNGRILAKYVRNGAIADIPATALWEGSSFRSNQLVLFQPVVFDREAIGTVYLQSDLEALYSRLKLYAGTFPVVLLAALLGAFLLSSRLQRVISGPILQLTEAANLISDQKNFAIRAVRQNSDELGHLVDRFNEMLSQIQERDAALQEGRDALEERVRERTNELQTEVAERRRAQEGLVLAKQAAETANRAKSEFLANMSHELRTPLNAILGYTELLIDDAEDTGHHNIVEDLQAIHTAGRHLLALISEILDFSKIEAGRMELCIEHLQAATLVQDVVTTIQPLLEKNANTLDVCCAASAGSIYNDATKMRQSLLNLLSNACKFTEKGKIGLKVTRETVDGMDWMLWSVSDTGIGIGPEDMSKLFSAFTQVDASTTRRYGGTGLGLAISRRFCRLMGGDIRVSSVLREGTTFTIRVPAKVVASSSSENATANPAREASPWNQEAIA